MALLAPASGTGARHRGPHREIVPSVILGTWLLLFTEVMFFAGLVGAFVILRGQAAPWPPYGQPRLPVAVSAVNSLFLLASGATMWRAIQAFREGRHPATGRLLIATVCLGATFLAVQGYEWARLVSFGLSATLSLYGALFYTLVGTHGLHVAGALAMLAIVTARTLGRAAAAAPPGRVGQDLTRVVGARRHEAALVAMGTFWSFVVLVWPLLFVLVYLG